MNERGIDMNKVYINEKKLDLQHRGRSYPWDMVQYKLCYGDIENIEIERVHHNNQSFTKIIVTIDNYYSSPEHILVELILRDDELIHVKCNRHKISINNLCVDALLAVVAVNELEISYDELPKKINWEEFVEEKEQKRFIQQSIKESEEFLNNYRMKYITDLFAEDLNYHLYVELHHELENDKYLWFSLKISNGKKSYVIKNVTRFVENLDRKKAEYFGVNNYWKLDYDSFDPDSQKIIDFLHKYVAKNLWQQKCSVFENEIDDFLLLTNELPTTHCSKHIPKSKLVPTIICENKTDYYELSLSFCYECTIIMGDTQLYEIGEKDLYWIPLDWQGRCKQLIAKFFEQSSMYVSMDDFYSLYQEYLQPLSSYIDIQCEDLTSKIVKPENIKIYSDLEENFVKVWGTYDVNDKTYPFFGDLQQYPINIMEVIITKYANSVENQIAIFKTKGKTLLQFLNEGIPHLQEYGEVFISEALMKLKMHKQMSLSVGLQMDHQLLKIDLDSNISKDELMSVLQAYRKKKTFYQLKNGDIVSLHGEAIQKFDELVGKMHLSKGEIAETEIERPIYDAIHFQEWNEELDVRSTKNIENYIQKLSQLTQRKAITVNEKYQAILRPYQIEGVEWMKQLHDLDLNGILADDMGLGKTIQVLCLLDLFTNKEDENIIICPSSLMYNWMQEIEKFNIDLDAVCVHGCQEDRKLCIQEKHQLYITTYDYLKRDIGLYRKMNFNYIILDEAHYIKNYITQNAKCVKLLSGKHRLALTGTPIENSLSELWSIFDFLLPGYLFDQSYFSKHYEKEIQIQKNIEKQKELKNMIEPFILRRTKDVVLKDLPDKIEKNIWMEFNDEEEKLYLANLMLVNEELQKQLEFEKVDSIIVLAMMTKLRQLCCEARMVYDQIQQPSTKLTACIELIEQFKENDKKVLVFSSFTKIFDFMIDEFNKKNIKYHMLTGKTSKENRKIEVDEFQHDDSTVFLISLKAGGTGLNLTSAEAVIHFDPWWNISAQNQATDRAYRIGQKNNVVVYKMLMKNSIEAKIHDMQNSKKELSDALISDTNMSIAKMDRETLKELFSIKK